MMKKSLLLFMSLILMLSVLSGCLSSKKAIVEVVYLQKDFTSVSFLDSNQNFYSDKKIDLGLSVFYINEETNEATMSIDCNLKDENNSFNLNYITAEFLDQKVSNDGMELPAGFTAWLKLDGDFDLKLNNYKDIKNIIISFEFEDSNGNKIKDNVKVKIDWSKAEVMNE